MIINGNKYITIRIKKMSIKYKLNLIQFKNYPTRGIMEDDTESWASFIYFKKIDYNSLKSILNRVINYDGKETHTEHYKRVKYIEKITKEVEKLKSEIDSLSYITYDESDDEVKHVTNKKKLISIAKSVSTSHKVITIIAIQNADNTYDYEVVYPSNLRSIRG